VVREGATGVSRMFKLSLWKGFQEGKRVSKEALVGKRKKGVLIWDGFDETRLTFQHKKKGDVVDTAQYGIQHKKMRGLYYYRRRCYVRNQAVGARLKKKKGKNHGLRLDFETGSD